MSHPEEPARPQHYPSAPPPPELSPQWAVEHPPETGIQDGWRAAPRELRPVVVLLAVNLAMSVALTVVTLALRHTIANYQLDHRHITDASQREAVRAGVIGGLVGRVIGNIVVSVVYVFLVRALLRGRRWAYRRVIWLASAGIVGLVLIQLTPYPVWMRVEQLVQALVLAALVYCVTRPAVREHFAPGLPGRDVKRFGRR